MLTAVDVYRPWETMATGGAYRVLICNWMKITELTYLVYVSLICKQNMINLFLSNSSYFIACSLGDCVLLGQVLTVYLC
jgi:hypothetical protein